MSSMIVVVLLAFHLFSVVNAQMDISTCGTMKGCLFAPPGCQPSSDCRIFFSYQVDGAYLDMELSGIPPSPNGYIAVGFSNDNMMGDDMVVFCGNFGGQITGGLARNDKKPSNTILSNVGIQNIMQTTIIGGKLYCAISQRLDPNQSTLYNLNSTYQILLVAGPTNGNRMGYHQTNRYVMPRVGLSAYVKGIGLVPGALRDEGDQSSHDKLMIAHGILMVLSWSIFIGTAILFARHMKEHFPDNIYWGLKLWFHFHRTLNMIGIAGTIAGFVVVFVAKDWRWVGPKPYQTAEQNNQWGSVHAMLGLIACVVAWAQPLNAVFRCHPEDKMRFIFNWIHGFLGYGAWLCAASATMIAVVHFTGMFSNRDAALGLYIAFIVVAGVSNIIMETLTFKVWWTNRDRIISSEMEMVRVDGRDSTPGRDEVMKIQATQLLLLTTFVVVAIGISIAISVLIGNKPNSS